MIEDYAVVFVGSAWYKMLRLCFIAGFAVHLFACIFFQVKSKNDNAIGFYSAKSVEIDVSFKKELLIGVCVLELMGVLFQDMTGKYVSS